MKVVYKDAFIAKLEDQVDYIAKDSPSRARKFKSDLISHLKRIPKIPINIDNQYILTIRKLET